MVFDELTKGSLFDAIIRNSGMLQIISIKEYPNNTPEDLTPILILTAVRIANNIYEMNLLCCVSIFVRKSNFRELYQSY